MEDFSWKGCLAPFLMVTQTEGGFLCLSIHHVTAGFATFTNPFFTSYFSLTISSGLFLSLSFPLSLCVSTLSFHFRVWKQSEHVLIRPG